MNMIEDLNPGGSPRRAHLEQRARCLFLKIRRIKDESGLWLGGLADAPCPTSSGGEQ
jgi:rhamnogalacturonyl hydrolase YesR